MDSSDEDLAKSSGDEGGHDLEYNLERTKERVKGLKETVSHLQAFIASATQFSAEKDEEIKKLKETIAELEGKKEPGKPKENGQGGGGDANGGEQPSNGEATDMDVAAN